MKALFLCALALLFACGPRILPYTFMMYSMEGGGISGRYGYGEIKGKGVDGENFTGTYSTIHRPQFNSRLVDLKGQAIFHGDRGTIIRCTYEGVYKGNRRDEGFGTCHTNRGKELYLQF